MPVTVTTMPIDDARFAGAPLLRLLQLTSPALPIGAFAYSQGLEQAVEAGWVGDEAGARDWIAGIATHALGHLDLPVLARLYRAWSVNDVETVKRWAVFLHACRESAELLEEDRQLGGALARLLDGLNVESAGAWQDDPLRSHAVLFALAAVRWGIPPVQTAQGFLYAWCENQITAAVKLVPLGQSAGQRILASLIDNIPAVVETALALPDDDIGLLTPSHAIASAQHERAYTRLFRS
jgi:urease accessory protein